MRPLLPAWSSGLQETSEELQPLSPAGPAEVAFSSFFRHLRVLFLSREIMEGPPNLQRSAVAVVFQAVTAAALESAECDSGVESPERLPSSECPEFYSFSCPESNSSIQEFCRNALCESHLTDRFL